MSEVLKSIEKIQEKAHNNIKDMLIRQFPNLYFYVSPKGFLSVWAKTKEGRDGAGVTIRPQINVGQILSHQWVLLTKLDKEIEIVRKQPKDYFFCTECGQVKPMSEFEENVFAGYYCKECAKKPEIANIINESHKRGFYD